MEALGAELAGPPWFFPLILPVPGVLGRDHGRKIAGNKKHLCLFSTEQISSIKTRTQCKL